MATRKFSRRPAVAPVKRPAVMLPAAPVAERHPLFQDYTTWLRDNVRCDPPKADFLDFWTWLELHYCC